MIRPLTAAILAAAGLGLAAVLLTSDPATTVGTDGAVSPPVVSPGAWSLPRLDPLSVAVGVLGGLLASKAWRIEWWRIPDMIRHWIGRSLRALGLAGLAMIASAIILFY